MKPPLHGGGFFFAPWPAEWSALPQKDGHASRRIGHAQEKSVLAVGVRTASARRRPDRQKIVHERNLSFDLTAPFSFALA
jgi:hypothetical protein